MSIAAGSRPPGRRPPPRRPGVVDRLDRPALGLVLPAAAEEPPAARGPVAEELDYHVLVDNAPAAVAAEIEAHPRRYPGVKVLRHTRRTYPAGDLAAHVLGYLGPVGSQGPAAGDDHAGG